MEGGKELLSSQEYLAFVSDLDELVGFGDQVHELDECRCPLSGFSASSQP